MHKTGNVLNKMLKSGQTKAKSMLHGLRTAETRADAHKVFNLFVKMFGRKYPKAVERLAKDRETILAFYDFRV